MGNVTGSIIIVLMGPKHAGKTSTGAALARFLGVPFADLDARIEGQTGKSPRALYREGPGVFRSAETVALTALLGELPGPDPESPGPAVRGVISAGGGIIDNDEAVALLRGEESLVLVYLEVSAETAWNRVLRNSSGGLPPFLDTPHPRETHRLLHERRAGAYTALAHLTVSGEAKTPEEAGLAILEALSIRVPQGSDDELDDNHPCPRVSRA